MTDARTELDAAVEALQHALALMESSGGGRLATLHVTHGLDHLMAERDALLLLESAAAGWRGPTRAR